ncbi:MAG TPA: DUF2066 domain-containing protein [Steroidobacteraceae bacterium]|nr:DUF2066 domain-containing protein [Steroidobacteraceae bacterium]
MRISTPASRAAGLILLCACALAALPAQALRLVRVYEVTVPGAPADLPGEAMRTALVRITGSRDAPADPQLAPLIANAAHYVQSTRPVEGGTQVVFDATALEHDVAAAGRGIWDAQRPFVLVVLSPQPAGSAADDMRTQLEQAAELRGLPMSVVPLPLADSTGSPLPDEVVLQSAQRLGADAVLIGRADATGTSWAWTLVTGFADHSWSGALTGGIDGAADQLASVGGGTGSQPLAQVQVQVDGVGTLNDYARVADILAQLPGLTYSELAAAQGGAATFALTIRGGADEVTRALAGSPHLVAGAEPLHFQYRP